MPPGTFLVRALATDLGLLAASLGVLAFFPGGVRLRLRAREILPVVVSFAAMFSVNLLASWAIGATGEPYSGLPEIPRGLLGAAVVLTAAVAAPASEELFFREALLARVFAGTPRAFALGTTSVGFSALHLGAGGPLLFLALTGMGLVLGFLRLRTGSLGAAILVHGANNLAASLLFLLGRG